MNKIIKITDHSRDKNTNNPYPRENIRKINNVHTPYIDGVISTISKLFSIKKTPAKSKKRLNKKFPKG